MSGIETLAFILAVAAAILFAVSAWSWVPERFNLVALGLCLLTASWIIVTPTFNIN